MARPSIAMFDFLDPILLERLSDPEVAAAWGDAQRNRREVSLDEVIDRGQLFELEESDPRRGMDNLV